MTDKDEARLRALLQDSGAEWLFLDGGLLEGARRALEGNGFPDTRALPTSC